MAAITLTNGMITQVDDEDFERFGSQNWQLVAGGKYAGRRVQRNRKVTMLYLHRLIADAVTGEDVHHRNGDRLDNRRSNLERMTKGEHSSHTIRSSAPRTGKYKGVHWWPDNCKSRLKRWVAHIKVDGRTRTIGYYMTPEEAARAYDREAYRLWGKTAYLNFPSDMEKAG